MLRGKPFTLSAIRVILVATILQNGVGALMRRSAPPNGKCIWYGNCAKNPDVGAHYNCRYDGPPKKLLNATHLKIVNELCPDLLNAEGEAYTCCDGAQLHELDTSNFKVIGAQTLSKCPACWANFRRYFCSIICGPYQGNYMHPSTLEVMVENNPPVPPRQSITSLELFVTRKLADDFYKSCKDVVGFAGSKVMQILCGQDYKTCTSTAFLKYLGDNPMAPFPIAVTISDEKTVMKHGRSFEPLDIAVKLCHLPVTMYGPSCSCSDCEGACRKGEFGEFCAIEAQVVATLLGMDYFVVFALFLFIVLTSLFLLSLGIIHLRKKRRNGEPRREILNDANVPVSKESLPLQESAGGIGEDASTDPPASPSHVDANDIGQPGSPKRKFRDFTFAATTRYTDLTYIIEAKVENMFYRWGRFCAKNPALILIGGLLCSVCLSMGILYFEVETEPINLWSTPTSRGRREMAYYEAHFPAMKRYEQVILTPVNPTRFQYNNEIIGPVFDHKFVLEAMVLQQKIENITTVYDGRIVRYSDVCYKPLKPDYDACAVLSVFNYFKNNYTRIRNMADTAFVDYVKSCALNPMRYDCFGAFGGPVHPFLVFGGYEEKRYMESSALAMIFVAENSYRKEDTAVVMAWEEAFLNFMKQYKGTYAKVTFFSERSVHDQLVEESHADISTVLFSYLIMFCYTAIGLGQVHSCRGLLVDSKVTLGFCGTMMVTLSVLSSIGLFGFLRIKATLIVLEVVPFMVLAVGIDNIFILVQAYQRDKRQANESREDQIGRVVGDVAPSMFLSSSTDALGFFLGTLSTMPAVRTFGLYAGTSCCIAFMLQISCFVSLCALDAKRQEDHRLDVCCCFHDPKKQGISEQRGLMYRFVKNIYAPFLLKTPVRIAVVIGFLAWLCSSVAVVNKISVGLEPELSMSSDSYVYKHIITFKKYMKIGPQVYFILKHNVNYSDPHIQLLLCNSAGCAGNSMLAHLSDAAERPNETYIGQSPLSWLDDYQSWMRSGCCNQHRANQSFCRVTRQATTSSCQSCQFTPQLVQSTPLVVGKEFVRYLPFYLQDNPTPQGCIGGHATYDVAVEILPNGEIGATYFAAYHIVPITSRDYYQALESANCIADTLTKFLNDNLPPSLDGEPYEVYAYSSFYVFYEQYLTMWTDTLLNLLFSSLLIFFMAFLILGLNFHLSAIIVFAVVLIVVNLLGSMYWWDIQLNAISLVNLVVAVGIAVEFCSHISRAFSISMAETKLLRTKVALQNMGSSVFSGITLTKFSGILVLAFARSQLFQIYYFRINLCIVLFGAAHGLMLLPCLLSFYGPAISQNRLLRRQQQLAQQQQPEQEVQS